LHHQRIPVKTPDIKSQIEPFHAILSNECYNQNEFQSYIEVYKVVRDYMIYYNTQRRHGSLGNTSPKQHYNALKNKEIETASFTS